MIKKSLFLSSLAFFFFNALIADCQNEFQSREGAIKLINAGAQISHDIQIDFGKKRSSSSCYLEAWPTSTEEVVDLIKIAYDYNIPIRTQGAAHSENGSALPQDHELLIHTNKLCHAKFGHFNTITADSGITIYELNQLLQNEMGYSIPVVNGGGPAPSVGGFISAGGIGISSEFFGGFWENIYSITLVTGNGKVMKISKGDDLFLFLFGSMGQLGIITDAELKLIPLEDNHPQEYPPIGTTLSMSNQPTDGRYWKQFEADKSIYWFNIFIPIHRLSEAKKDLKKLQKRYPNALNYEKIYRWKITNNSRLPPMIYDIDYQDLIVLGVWGTQSESSKSESELLKLNDDFNQLTLKKKYRRYIQVEFNGSPELYEMYFSKETFEKFKEIKKNLDPKFLFNRNSFFRNE